MGEKGNAYKVLVKNPNRKDPLEKVRRRCEDNIKIEFEVMGWKDVEWIHLAG
jgi:hypothetical protein